MTVQEYLAGKTYPGRGIILGKSPDGAAMAAYFIMGRSENSRNRVFVKMPDGIKTRAFDEARLTDPSLIIYSPLRRLEGAMVVTNGDQTDTVCSFIRSGRSFQEALDTRQFEPDAPNFTPRISGIVCFAGGDFTYKLSILKSADAAGSGCQRHCYSYPALCGQGHIIHTYQGDGNPLPSFAGEPVKLSLPEDLDCFARELWEALDGDNKVSLYACRMEPDTGELRELIFNKNLGE